MSRNIKVEIEIKKTIHVNFRERDVTNRPWDWHTEDSESTEYFQTIGQAIDDAEKVLGA